MAAGPRRAGGPRGNPAAMFLQRRSELQLTDDQVKRLEALKDAPSVRTNEADLLRARADLLEATQGDGNLTKARAALDRMSALRNERMVAALKQRQDARGVLTAQQKTRLDNFRSERGARGGMRGQRGVRGERGARGPGAGQFRGQPRGNFRPGTPMVPGMNRGPARQGAPVPPL